MNQRQNQTGNLMIGILVGLTVGLIAVGGVLWYMNNHKPSYDNLNKAEEDARSALSTSSTVEELTPSGASETIIEFRPSEHPVVVSAPDRDENIENNPEVIINGGSHPEPEESIVAPPKKITQPEQTTKAIDKNPQATVRANNKEPIKPVAKRSFLQVGAFKEFSQAEKQKAQLALLGVEASIQQIDLGGNKGMFHRVRVGPFTDDIQMREVQESLKENDIKSNVVNQN